MTQIISCDWGTSALRLRLVDAKAATVLAEARSIDGISNTFELWKKSGKTEDERSSFYQSVLSNQIRKLEEQVRSSLDEVPIVISGMASSNIGMVELPYKEIPFNINDRGLNVERIDANDAFRHHILLISGVRTIDDVMRGEETQLIGCMDKEDIEERLFIFPGTHSKHAIVKNGSFTGFKTYMTGEFFDVLSTKTILSSSVKPGEGLIDESARKSFEEGVKASGQSNLLHNSFLARTNHIFKKLTQDQNYYYLSGVIIGAELEELIPGGNQITLVASGEIRELYSMALKVKFGDRFNFRFEDPDLALVKGQLKVVNDLDI
jgi:2-dehydro-3-deoxygalactonokinase